MSTHAAVTGALGPAFAPSTSEERLPVSHKMQNITVVTGCFNEEDNITEFYDRICKAFESSLPEYSFDLIVIDNASSDKTVEVLKAIAAGDKRVRIIVNNRNFGHIRSVYHAFLQATGNAVVVMASDLQDPPEMIPQFVRKWEEGSMIVLAQKTSTDESMLFALLRRTYYDTVNRLSDIELIKDVTGFGLYDKRVVADVRRVNDPYPYFRGLICDLGYQHTLLPFQKPARKRGLTKNNLYTLWDMAMLGITNHSKVPLRLATFGGFIVSAFSFLVALGYVVYKLFYWDDFQVGQAPLVIGIFFIGAVQLIFIGLLGEYIGSIHTQILKRPPVIEKERINFD